VDRSTEYPLAFAGVLRLNPQVAIEGEETLFRHIKKALDRSRPFPDAVFESKVGRLEPAQRVPDHPQHRVVARGDLSDLSEGLHVQVGIDVTGRTLSLHPGIQIDEFGGRPVFRDIEAGDLVLLGDP
jgi:hypothetical protein